MTKICCISSHGGHLHELTRAVRNVKGEKYWVTYKTAHTSAILVDKKHYFIIDPVTSKWKFLINGFQSLKHLIRERPNYVISTGAGMSVPTMLMAKYILRAKIIFIESAAALVEPTKTGKFIYPMSDLFLIQWESLRNFYPNAIYTGLL